MLVGSTGCTDIHANNKKYEKKGKEKEIYRHSSR
jgi:hypothetical protein